MQRLKKCVQSQNRKYLINFFFEDTLRNCKNGSREIFKHFFKFILWKKYESNLKSFYIIYEAFQENNSKFGHISILVYSKQTRKML